MTERGPAPGRPAAPVRRREPPALDAHDILFAEGLAAESYLDSGNRAMFENAGLPMIPHPDLSGERCASGACDTEVEPIWRRLAERSVSLGHMPFEAPATAPPELSLVANETTLRAVFCDRGRYVFALPPGTASVRIVSRAARPSDRRPWLDDRRRLGVSIERIVLADGAGPWDVALDAPGLGVGWHAVERDARRRARRWTDGGAELAVPPGTAMAEIVLAAGA